MSYFNKFPYTTYDIGGKTHLVRDFFRRAAFVSEHKPLADLYETYTVKEGESAQSVALDFYGSALYHWVVLIFNEIHDQHFDWPLDQLSLEKYCQEKYGANTMYMTRHYEQDGNVIGEFKDFISQEGGELSWNPPQNPGPENPLIYPVSFIEWETRLNDAKRKILILRPALLSEFVNQYEASVNV
jgi:hypothetical protein